MYGFVSQMRAEIPKRSEQQWMLKVVQRQSGVILMSLKLMLRGYFFIYVLDVF